MNQAPAISDLRNVVAYHNRRELLASDADQDTAEIIKYIVWSHNHYKKDYDKLCEKFWQGNAKDTAKMIFDLHKKYITYRIEPESMQSVKSPGAILHDKHGDCKHYALFTTGIIEALHRKGFPVTSFYRFVADRPGMDVHHVFSVIQDDQGNEYWCDPVIHQFNGRPDFHKSVDKHVNKGVGAIYSISGTNNFYDIPNVGGVGKTNIFKQFVHAMDVNFQNAKHAVQVNSANVKKVVQQQVHAAQVNTQNLKKAVKQQVHAMDVNIHNAGKEIKKDLKAVKTATIKVGLVPARKAFLGILALNVHGLATTLDQVRKNPGEREHLNQKWVKDCGGDWGTLDRTITAGAKRKRILGTENHMIGFEPTTIATMVTLAAAIIAILGPLLKARPGTQAQLNDMATAGAANMLASTYGAANAINTLADPNATQAQYNAANSYLAPGPQQFIDDTGMAPNNMNMAVTPGVTPDGTPMLTVNDVSGPLVPATGGGGSSSVMSWVNSGLDSLKNVWQEHKGIILTVSAVGVAGYIIVSRKRKPRRK